MTDVSLFGCFKFGVYTMAETSVFCYLASILLVISPCFSYTPKGNPKAIAQVAPNARFTVLTSRLIRMEWAPAGHNTGVIEFNDDATFAFINQYMEDDDVPKCTATNMGENRISIKTDYITVFFKCVDQQIFHDIQF